METKGKANTPLAKPAKRLPGARSERGRQHTKGVRSHCCRGQQHISDRHQQIETGRVVDNLTPPLQNLHKEKRLPAPLVDAAPEQHIHKVIYLMTRRK